VLVAGGRALGELSRHELVAGSAALKSVSIQVRSLSQSRHSFCSRLCDVSLSQRVCARSYQFVDFVYVFGKLLLVECVIMSRRV